MNTKQATADPLKKAMGDRTKADLARHLNVADSTVHRWFNGTTPHRFYRRQIAAWLNADEAVLFPPKEKD